MSDRREALKIIGAIGATCAFPYESGELYGQHVHASSGAVAPLPQPKYFSAGDLGVVSRVADLIIPATDTPGALAAGVPAYIDMVVGGNEQHQKVFRAGIDWLNAASTRGHGKIFVDMSEDQQIAILTPLSDLVDARNFDSTEAKFFRAIKSMTADGYYTSVIGLRDELGYRGNTALATFPGCEVPEH